MNSRRFRKRGVIRKFLTASNPPFSLQQIHSPNLFASTTPTSSLPLAAASISGVSRSLFLLTISSSWPISIKNSAIAVNPCRAARCKLVLDLSEKSGLRRMDGLKRMMRCTRGRSLRRMARRRRRETSILGDVVNWVVRSC